MDAPEQLMEVKPEADLGLPGSGVQSPAGQEGSIWDHQGSGTLMTLSSDFLGLTRCFLLQTNPMALCLAVVHVDQLQRQLPKVTRTWESLPIVLPNPLMFVLPSLRYSFGDSVDR